MSRKRLGCLVVQAIPSTNIAAGSNAMSGWISATGADRLCVTMQNDASPPTSAADVQWSHDGLVRHASSYEVIETGTGSARVGAIEIMAPFFRVVINNKDTVAHTMAAQVYLKG